MGINEYNIVPIIFPKSSFKMSKLQGRMSTKLDIFKDKKTLNENKKLFLRLTTELYKNIENWKKLKPIIGLIEDFFKVAKDAFGLGIFHSYTQKSMRKNIYLCLLLTTLVIQQGFKTKTQLQKLAEGIIELKPTKNNNDKKEKSNAKKTNKQKVVEETDLQSTLEVKIRKQVMLDYF